MEKKKYKEKDKKNNIVSKDYNYRINLKTEEILSEDDSKIIDMNIAESDGTE